MTPKPPVQLLVFTFGSDASFEGRLVGAIERIEVGGSLKVLEALYVRRDRAGELTAVDLRGRGAGGGMTAPLLSFRLDERARRRATERALGGDSAVKGETLRELGDGLEPGTALAALLVEHTWAIALDDAVERTGGTTVAEGFVDATELSALMPELVAASHAGAS